MITIKDMEMPKSCSECRFRKVLGLQFYCMVNGKCIDNEVHAKNTHPQCPLQDITMLISKVKILEDSIKFKNNLIYGHNLVDDESIIAINELNIALGGKE